VLIAHHPKLIGDTLLLTPLAAKALSRLAEGRDRHDRLARDAAAVRLPALSVDAVLYDPADAATLDGFGRGKGFDLAFVPGDNRYGCGCPRRGRAGSWASTAIGRATRTCCSTTARLPVDAGHLERHGRGLRRRR
jgi:hypothetical protein